MNAAAVEAATTHAWSVRMSPGQWQQQLDQVLEGVPSSERVRVAQHLSPWLVDTVCRADFPSPLLLAYLAKGIACGTLDFASVLDAFSGHFDLAADTETRTGAVLASLHQLMQLLLFHNQVYWDADLFTTRPLPGTWSDLLQTLARGAGADRLAKAIARVVQRVVACASHPSAVLLLSSLADNTFLVLFHRLGRLLLPDLPPLPAPSLDLLDAPDTASVYHALKQLHRPLAASSTSLLGCWSSGALHAAMRPVLRLVVSQLRCGVWALLLLPIDDLAGRIDALATCCAWTDRVEMLAVFLATVLDHASVSSDAFLFARVPLLIKALDRSADAHDTHAAFQLVPCLLTSPDASAASLHRMQRILCGSDAPLSLSTDISSARVQDVEAMMHQGRLVTLLGETLDAIHRVWNAHLDDTDAVAVMNDAVPLLHLIFRVARVRHVQQNRSIIMQHVAGVPDRYPPAIVAYVTQLLMPGTGTASSSSAPASSFASSDDQAFSVDEDAMLDEQQWEKLPLLSLAAHAGFVPITGTVAKAHQLAAAAPFTVPDLLVAMHHHAELAEVSKFVSDLTVPQTTNLQYLMRAATTPEPVPEHQLDTLVSRLMRLDSLDDSAVSDAFSHLWHLAGALDAHSLVSQLLCQLRSQVDVNVTAGPLWCRAVVAVEIVVQVLCDLSPLGSQHAVFASVLLEAASDHAHDILRHLYVHLIVRLAVLCPGCEALLVSFLADSVAQCVSIRPSAGLVLPMMLCRRLVDVAPSILRGVDVAPLVTALHTAGETELALQMFDLSTVEGARAAVSALVFDFRE